MVVDKPWGRRLVICCDGTWQSSVSRRENFPSNVTRLCRMVSRVGKDQDDPSKKWHQIVYYDSGIGTGNLTSHERRRQGGTGAGLSENVIEAYNFIVMNYEAGDEIFCFGFSRGAYTARAVAGLVSDIGVIETVDMQFFPEIYRAYMSNSQGKLFSGNRAWVEFVKGRRSKKGEEMLRNGLHISKADTRAQAEAWDIHPHGELAVNKDSRRVKVVGVWDTVGSLGIPDVVGLDFASKRTRYGFHNVKLTEHIEHAFQALALDERRKAFRPTLWYIPHDLVESDTRKTPELKQVWFPGVHINCGGGSDDAISEMKGDIENLSMATFAWMLQCVAPYLTISPDAFNKHVAQYDRWLNKIRYSCTYHHVAKESTFEWLWSKVPDVPYIGEEMDQLAAPKRDPPHSHEEFDYGWGTGPIVDSYRGVYLANGTHTREPGHEEAEVFDSKAKKYKWKPINESGHTNEYIHPIVHHRRVVRGWDAHSPLRKWTRIAGDGRFWWHKEGESDRALPEWIILPSEPESFSYERMFYAQCEKSERTVKALAKETKGRDFMVDLDSKVDFEAVKKPVAEYP